MGGQPLLQISRPADIGFGWSGVTALQQIDKTGLDDWRCDCGLTWLR